MLPQPMPADLGTREKLLYAAEECLLTLGHAAATVKEVARVAGVNHGLVHHYFGSKEQLFVELLQYVCKLDKERMKYIVTRDQLLDMLEKELMEDARMMVEIHAMANQMSELRAALADMFRDHVVDFWRPYPVPYDTVWLLISGISGLAMLSSVVPDLPLRRMLDELFTKLGGPELEQAFSREPVAVVPSVK
jgi:AcrR family transcriptional regulator